MTPLAPPGLLNRSKGGVKGGIRPVSSVGRPPGSLTPKISIVYGRCLSVTGRYLTVKGGVFPNLGPSPATQECNLSVQANILRDQRAHQAPIQPTKTSTADGLCL